MRDGEMHGYQRGQYVFGVNPELVSEATVARIIALIEAEVTASPDPNAPDAKWPVPAFWLEKDDTA